MDNEDEVDGCDIDYTQDQLNDDEEDLFALFPDGTDPDKAAEWKELFRG